MYTLLYFFIYQWLCSVFAATHRLSLVAVPGGSSLVMVCGLLIAVASLVMEHRLQGEQASAVCSTGAHQLWLESPRVCRLQQFAAQGLISCGSRALECAGFSSCMLGLSSCGSRALECAGFSSCMLGLSSCGAQAQLLCSIWNLPGPGIDPMSPALAGRFLSTAPAGRSSNYIFMSVGTCGYFIFWVIIQCYLILLLKLFQLWPLEVLSLDFWVPLTHHQDCGNFYFLRTTYFLA